MRKLLSYYEQFRIAGHRAIDAHRNASIVERFKGQDRFDIRWDEEREGYFSVYGEPDTPEERAEIQDLIDRWGCVVVYVYDRLRRETVDSVGMCIYAHPDNPLENPYVVNLMQAGLDVLANDCPACGGTGRTTH